MPRTCYVDREFRPDARYLIRQANEIIDEYQAAGFGLTLRQLYYQFVSRDLIKNKDTEYKRLGSIINDARLAGLVDWYAIADRTRAHHGGGGWTSVSSIVRAMGDAYSIDKWEDQDVRVEVWVEKEALVDVIARAANRENVGYFACKGYTSASAMWEAAQRIGTYIEGGQRVVILHLGDHDPSGMDMTRDIRQRLSMFLSVDLGRTGSDDTMEWHEDGVDQDFEVNRIALNIDQIVEHNPPPNPAKLTDSRAFEYIHEFGSSSWELDALDPATLVRLITSEIDALRDEDQWNARVEREHVERKALTAASKHWPKVQELLGTLEDLSGTLIDPNDTEDDDDL